MNVPCPSGSRFLRESGLCCFRVQAVRTLVLLLVEFAFSPWFSAVPGTQAVGLGWDVAGPLALVMERPDFW